MRTGEQNEGTHNADKLLTLSLMLHCAFNSSPHILCRQVFAVMQRSKTLFVGNAACHSNIKCSCTPLPDSCEPQLLFQNILAGIAMVFSNYRSVKTIAGP